MKRRKIVARICAFTLAASLIAIDTLPAFAAAVSAEPLVDRMQAEEENFSDKAVASTEDTGAENIEGTEMVKETEPESETEMSNATETEPEIVPVPSPGENQETQPDGQEKNDGLIYVDDALYSGYYIDNSGILYIVSNGAAEPVNGMVNEGTKYYSLNDDGMMTLLMQTVFVAGGAYTGYYMDNAGILYMVSAGAAVPETGTVNAGVTYYSLKDAGTMTLPKQTIFLEGKVYRGHYKDANGKMCKVTGGKLELKTGIMGKGSKYYSCNEKKMLTLSKRTLYVKGERYSGYYMNKANKMNSVKKGVLTLKTGIVKKGTRYYNYNTKKTKTLSKQTLYVKGKVYNGYYMDNKSKMYSVKKGTRTLKTGVVKKGTKYYSYKPKKTKKLSKETLYVKGKAYNGYYLDDKNEMYSVKKGTLTLVTGVMGKETKYYSYQLEKTEKLSGDTLYVDGKVYSGYCLGNDNKMYTVSNDTCTPVNAMLSAGTAYYNGNENKMLTLPGQMIYVYGKAMEWMNLDQMATLQKAQAVVQSVSEPADSKSEKLYKCFLWMKKFPYVQYRTMSEAYANGPWSWDVVFANDIFDKFSGCCASGACAFAYMAKACGYENVTICSDTKHAWVDIDGRLYDPLFAKDRDFSKNYDAEYTDYRIHPAYTMTL